MSEDGTEGAGSARALGTTTSPPDDPRRRHPRRDTPATTYRTRCHARMARGLADALPYVLVSSQKPVATRRRGQNCGNARGSRRPVEDPPGAPRELERRCQRPANIDQLAVGTFHWRRHACTTCPAGATASTALPPSWSFRYRGHEDDGTCGSSWSVQTLGARGACVVHSECARRVTCRCHA
jgi:hypothetical protein